MYNTILVAPSFDRHLRVFSFSFSQDIAAFGGPAGQPPLAIYNLFLGMGAFRPLSTLINLGFNLPSNSHIYSFSGDPPFLHNLNHKLLGQFIWVPLHKPLKKVGKKKFHAPGGVFFWGTRTTTTTCWHIPLPTYSYSSEFRFP